ncbi:MAG: DUF2461 family protein [Candidatus Kryptoniota bacterium]
MPADKKTFEENLQFSGFYPETFEFLDGLHRNNRVEWFHKHREIYEQYLLLPAKSFVSAIGPFIKFINPALETEPKFNKSLVRLNKDMRFAKKPYKDFFLIRFGRVKWDSELFLYLDRNGIEIGAFINNEKASGRLFDENLSKFTDSFIEVCHKYKIDGQFTAYELHSGSDPIANRFRAKRDYQKLRGITYLIFGKEQMKTDPVVTSKSLLAMAMKIYNRLYPIYIFATSENPLKDLEIYDKKVGLLEIKAR